MERLHIDAVSAPCKETLAAQGIPNLTHMSTDSVESLWGCGSDPTPGFFDRLTTPLYGAALEYQRIHRNFRCCDYR